MGFLHSIDLKILEINKLLDTGIIAETFKLGWSNGSLNLITPIALDLQEKQSLLRKSYEWYGKLNLFSDVAKAENVRFDILTTRPSNQQLFPAYDTALSVIESSDATIKIIEESSLEAYTEQIEKYLPIVETDIF
ncbi:MAG: hypothetical protein ABIX01_11120 [Chitinophagaceae bacterium]